MILKREVELPRPRDTGAAAAALWIAVMCGLLGLGAAWVRVCEDEGNMGVRLQQHLGPATTLDAGQWSSETASGQPAVCCPGCGEITELDGDHEVTPDGRVVPIFSCPRPGCPFMEFLTLELSE